MRVRHFITLCSLAALCASAAMVGCKKDLLDDASARLTFSNDTVYFDTTLTQLGTRTEQLVVHNPCSNTISIDEIYIRGGSSSEYIINVNGMSQGSASNVEIAAHDSMYIFVQAKLSRNNFDTLGFHVDDLVFTFNNKEQVVKLASWGKDAESLSGQQPGTTTWAAGKSFLITDSLVVGTGCTLTIEEGVSVYFKPKANLVINGTLVVNGSVSRPVVFQGHRLEYYYQQRAGQWGSIIFRPTSTGNKISNASISNGTGGLMLEEGTTTQANIQLENVKIEGMSYAGISCSNASLTAVNCVVADCDDYAVKISNGGTYSFIHTTISNYDNSTTRLTSSLYLTNTNDEETQATNPLEFEMKNSILAGSCQDELYLVKNDNAGFDIAFTYCLIKQEEKNEYMDDSTTLVESSDYLFKDMDEDFDIDSTSVARDKGSFSTAELHPADFKGHSRTRDGKPDLGAYEYSSE